MLLLITYSCKKEFADIDSKQKLSVIGKEDVRNWSYDEKVSYSEKNLLIVGKVISNLWQQKSFKKTLINEIENNKFMKDKGEILLSDVLKTIAKNSSKIKISKKQIKLLQEGISAFKGIDNGKDVQPQLYFLNFKEIKNTLLNKNDDSTKPTIVIGIEDNKTDYAGYKENNNGDLEQLPDLISEQEAKQISNLIIIGFNEDGGCARPTTLPGSDDFPYTWYKLKLKRLGLNGHKDSWAKGGDEVRFKAVSVHHGYGYNPSDPSDKDYYYGDVIGSTNNVTGIYVKDFTRDDINHNRTFTVNKVYTNTFVNAPDSFFNQFPSSEPDFIPYDAPRGSYAINKDQIFIILYEYDGWPISRSYYPSIDPLSYELGVQKSIANTEKLRIRTAVGGVYSAMWVHNVPFTTYNDASTGMLNLRHTDENFVNLSCVSVLDHDCMSPYTP